MKRTIGYIIVILSVTLNVNAQPVKLSLQDALSKGLQNNFAILISANDAEIARNNNSIGNAGFLPSLSANGSFRDSYSDIRTESQLNEIIKTQNANSITLAGGVSLDWTLFDGFNMFQRKDKLEMLQESGELNYRSMVENVLSEIIVSYYIVVQASNRLEVLKNAIDFSNNRLDLVRKKYEIGSSSELAYLQATTDLNADSAAYLRQLAVLRNAKTNLNSLLVEKYDTDFDTDREILFDKMVDISSVMDSLSSGNKSVQLAKIRSMVADLDYKISNGPKYPQLAFFADYNLSNTKNDFGQTRRNQSFGPQFGLNLAIPIFDGGNKRRQSVNARINAESSRLEFEQILTEAQSALYQVYNDYITNVQLVKLEQSNLAVSRQNTKIAFEKYRVGEISDIDLRQIQLTQLEAENSLLVAQFQAKKSETELMRLTGKIISNE